MYKILIYPEREKKLGSLSTQEWGEFIIILFDFYRYMETQNNPLGFDHELFTNRVLKISFDTIKEVIVNDRTNYQLRVKVNQENGKKGGRKPKVKNNPNKPRQTQVNPEGYSGKKPSISISNSIILFNKEEYKFVDEFIDKDNTQIKYQISKNASYIENQYKEVDKLIYDGYSIELIKTVLNFIRQDEFWSKQILSIKKLREKNKNGIPYMVVMIDKIKERKPKILDLSSYNLTNGN